MLGTGYTTRPTFRPGAVVLELVYAPAAMARTVEDLHTYLRAMGRSFETTEGGTVVLAPSREGQPPVGIRVEDPVVFSVEIGNVPPMDPAKEAAIFRRLLELNAGDLLYCAYGLRGSTIVLSSAHELSNMDLNEVQAILSDIDVALATHLKELVTLVQGEPASRRGGK